MNEKQFLELKNKLSQFNFWEKETHGERGLDGEEWILEGYSNGKYHFLTRWSPDSYGDKNYVELCEYFEKIFNEK